MTKNVFLYMCYIHVFLKLQGRKIVKKIKYVRLASVHKLTLRKTLAWRKVPVHYLMLIIY